MSTTKSTPDPLNRADKALALALSLAHAEIRLHALTAGQVDAIVDPAGRTYLLRPAQEHLRQNERRLQAVIESAGDVITVLDRGGRIISQNRVATRLLGYEPGNLVGRSLFDLVHPDDLPQFYSAFFNVIEEFQVDAIVQFRHRHSDGSYRALEATVSRLRDVSVSLVVLVCRDVIRQLRSGYSGAHQEITPIEAAQSPDDAPAATGVVHAPPVTPPTPPPRRAP